MEFSSALEFKISSQQAIHYCVGIHSPLKSFRDFSRRPHHHPNQHTFDKIRLIFNMNRCNPHTGLIVFWIKLSPRGCSHPMTSLYWCLKKQGGLALPPSNPRYFHKPYKQMYHSSQRIQVDAKFVPSACLVNRQVVEKHFSNILPLISTTGALC